MVSSTNGLSVFHEKNQDLIKELATYSSIINVDDLIEKDKKLLIGLYLEYKLDGFKPRAALKKAKLVLESFNF